MLLAVSRVHETRAAVPGRGPEARLGGSLRDRKVAVLGLDFKRDSDDVRDSLSLQADPPARARARPRGAPRPARADRVRAARRRPCADADAVVIATNHSEFEDLLDRAARDARAARRPLERDGRRPGIRLAVRRARWPAVMSTVLVTGGAGTIGAAVVRRLRARRRLGGARVRPARGAGLDARGLRDPHRRPARPRRGARRRSRGCTHVIHLAAIVGGIAQLPQAPAHAARGQQRALQRDLPRRARAARRAAASTCPPRWCSSARPSSRPPRSTSTTARRRSPPTASRSWRARLLPRPARRARPAYTICRPFNAYGPGEMPEDEPGIAHMVPDLIRKVLAGTAAAADLRLGRADAHAHPRRRHRRRASSRRWPPGGRERGLQHLRLRRAHRRGDRPDDLGGLRRGPGRRSSSSTCRASRSTSSGAGRRSTKAERLLGWEAQIDLRDGIARRSSGSRAGSARPLSSAMRSG